MRSSNPISGQQAPITQPTIRDVSALYQELLGRPGQEEYLQNWAQSGGTLEQIRAGIAGSPEGIAFAASQGGGGTSPAGGTTDAGGIPDWFSSYTDQLSAMQAEINGATSRRRFVFGRVGRSSGWSTASGRSSGWRNPRNFFW